MQIDIVTIFPGMFQGPFQESMVKRAIEKGLVKINVVDLRDYSEGKHRQVDDYPYGGGKGMVLKPEPLFAAVEDLLSGKSPKSRVLLLSPGGKVFNQEYAEKLSGEEHIILLCGHYEGVDERVHEHLVHEEISIGDYVLTGGEIPAMVITDSVVRLLPGFLPEETLAEESFAEGLLEYPQYTRPPVFKGIQVPDVLLSGNHGLIKEWRRQQAIEKTYRHRPDLLSETILSSEEKNKYRANSNNQD